MGLCLRREWKFGQHRLEGASGLCGLRSDPEFRRGNKGPSFGFSGGEQKCLSRHSLLYLWRQQCSRGTCRGIPASMQGGRRGCFPCIQMGVSCGPCGNAVVCDLHGEGRTCCHGGSLHIIRQCGRGLIREHELECGREGVGNCVR